MNRRNFFRQLASGIIVAAAPNIFVPQLIKPQWRRSTLIRAQYHWWTVENGLILGWKELPPVDVLERSELIAESKLIFSYETANLARLKTP